jgi:disulfide bond formation protein DsbB
MLSVFPLTQVLAKVLSGSGECARIDWRFLGLAMPAWVLIACIALGAWGLWANLRHRPPVLKF